VSVSPVERKTIELTNQTIQTLSALCNDFQEGAGRSDPRLDEATRIWKNAVIAMLHSEVKIVNTRIAPLSCLQGFAIAAQKEAVATTQSDIAMVKKVNASLSP
jgi:hypothetical protein